jgi:hypothetical protein
MPLRKGFGEKAYDAIEERHGLIWSIALVDCASNATA